MLDGVPGQARVVDDLRAGLSRQQGLRQQADQVIALDEAPGSSKKKQRSKSPSQAMPQIGPCSAPLVAVASRHSGSSGLGMPCGKVPSGSW
jgi:hypothetical protein